MCNARKTQVYCTHDACDACDACHAAYLECLTPSDDSPRARLPNLSSLLCPPTVDGSVMDAGKSIAKSAAASLSPVSLLLLSLLLASGAAAVGGCTSTDLQKQRGNEPRLLMVVFRLELGCLSTPIDLQQ